MIGNYTDIRNEDGAKLLNWDASVCYPNNDVYCSTFMLTL